MKKLPLFLFLAFSLQPLHADGDTVGDILKLLKEKRVRLEYSFKSGGEVPVTGKGEAEIQGNCFRISGNGLEIFCDGKSRWIADPNSKELIIEKAGGSDDFTSDPAACLQRLTGLKSESGIITGTFIADDGQSVYFKLSHIKEEPMSEDLSEFRYLQDKSGKDWVVSDLR